MSCRKKALAAFSLLASFGAQAIVFPNADKSYDLASETAWVTNGIPCYPSTTATVVPGAGTLTLSKDLTIGYIQHNGNPSTVIDMFATPERVLTFTSSSYFLFPYNPSAKIEFRGGKVAANGGVANIATDKASSNRMTLSGGSVVTNVGNIITRVAESTKQGLALVLKEQSKLYATQLTHKFNSEELGYSFTGDPTEPGVSIDIADGSSARFSTGFNVGGGVTLIRGAGTTVEVATTSATGSNVAGNYHNAALHVTDGATFTTPGGLQFSSASKVTNGWVVIDNCATGLFNQVHQGSNWADFGQDRHFVVGADAYVKISGDYGHRLTGTNNWLVVSNGSYSTKLLTVTGVGHRLEVRGPRAAFTKGNSYLFDSGFGHRMTISDGAKIAFPGVYVDNTACSNTLEVTGAGTELDVTSSFYLQPHQANRMARGSAVRVTDNATLRVAGSFLVMGYDLSVVVSNATIEGTCTVPNAYWGYAKASENEVASSNCALRFEGTTPKVKIAGNAYLYRGACLQFHVPPTGYAADHVPLELNSIGTWHNDVRFELEGLEELLKTLPDSCDMTLIQMGDGWLPADNNVCWDQVRASLPKDITLTVTPDAKKLVLHAKVHKGLMLIVR